MVRSFGVCSGWHLTVQLYNESTSVLEIIATNDGAAQIQVLPHTVSQVIRELIKVVVRGVSRHSRKAGTRKRQETRNDGREKMKKEKKELRCRKEDSTSTSTQPRWCQGNNDGRITGPVWLQAIGPSQVEGPLFWQAVGDVHRNSPKTLSQNRALPMESPQSCCKTGPLQQAKVKRLRFFCYIFL